MTLLRALAFIVALVAFGAAAQTPGFVPLAGLPSSAAPPAGTTWDPANSNSNIAFSDGNLTVSTTFTHLAASRATSSIGNGDLRYYEITINATNAGFTDALGVANSSLSTADDAALGFDTNVSNGWYPGSGTIVANSGVVTTIQTATTAAVVGFAVNGHNKYWITTDGTTWNNDIIANQNPVGNVGGLDISALGDVFPAVTIIGQPVATSLTANFGATAFTYSIPTGYSHF